MATANSTPLRPTPTELRAPFEVTIFQAAQLKANWLAQLDGAAIDLDLSQVADIDTSGMQLLLFLKQVAAQRGLALRLCDPSPAVVEFSGLLGLDPLLPMTACQPASTEARDGSI